MGSANGYTLNMLGEKIIRHLIERNDNKQTTKDITNVIELKNKKKSFSDIVFYHFQHDFLKNFNQKNKKSYVKISKNSTYSFEFWKTFCYLFNNVL